MKLYLLVYSLVCKVSDYIANTLFLKCLNLTAVSSAGRLIRGS